MIAATQSNHPLAPVAPADVKETALTEASNRIRRAGMRITQPRLAIIASLHRHEGPVSCERIHQDVGAGVCDLVTVYRCLAVFEELGLVRRSYLHSGTCLYELTLTTLRHYHIMCKACGRAERMEYFPVEGVERLLTERGYAQVSHVVEFFGVCPQCQSAAAARRVAPIIPEARL